MTEIVIIAALDRHRAIGKDGKMPWHLPDDLKGFKAYTMGKPILMGRKTAQSLSRALPGRLNLVLTRSGEVPCEGMRAVGSVEDALRVAAAEGSSVLCVIGGGEVYAAALPIATRLRITHVDGDVENPDTYFPAVDRPAWVAVSWDEHGADAHHPYPFTVVEYARSQPGSPGGAEIT